MKCLSDIKILRISILLTVLLFFGFQKGNCQSEFSNDSSDYYVVKSNYPTQSFFSKTKFLIDSSGALSIESILSDPASVNFALLQDSVIEGEQFVWLKLKIKSEIEINDWWLIMRNEESKVTYVTWTHNEVDFYFVKNDQISKHAKSGLLVPASQKEIRYPNSVSRTYISLKKGETVDIYIRIKTLQRAFLSAELRDPVLSLPNPIVGGFKGFNTLKDFTIIISCYILFFYFYTRDVSYLYLFGMLICELLYHQILHPYSPFIDWFIPENPHLYRYAFSLFTSAKVIFFLQFGRTFTDLESISPIWDKVIIWTMGMTALSFVIGSVTFAIDPGVAKKLSLFITLPIFLAIITIVIRLAFFKNSLIRHFVAGGLWLFVFSFLGVLWESGLLPFLGSINPWIIANAGFLIIFALALARKIQISERAKLEVEKVKAVDSIKSKFFANISHEFRTPLTLILGPINQSLESIPSSEVVDDNSELPVKGKYLKVMKHNAQRLQNLVDQILDLSKLDQGQMRLQVAEGDLIQFVRSIVFSFESLAERKHIHFQTHFPTEIESTWFDRDKLEKIIVNLLSNAFKFTPEHGEVSVQLEATGNKIKFAVSDTGGGMKAMEVNKIFDRFYQTESTSDQGTGIGLSLVKELVDLHRGQISVDSREGEGTVFKVTLPYLVADFRADEISKLPQNSETSTPNQNDWMTESDFESVTNEETVNLPVLLIVEDNPDLRHYISEQMHVGFKIVMAKDGEEGFKLAETHLPDLIISDVMMPKMNGLEMCQLVKSNIKTSHIPLILLTAKAGQVAKIEGLECGADDYLTKPFDGRELKARAKNLIEQRKLLRDKFAGELKIRPTEITLNSMDEQFVKQVMEEIEKNMSNEYYSVENLASAIGFSRSQLYRKIKSISGKSPNQLIRDFRLTRAKEMLEQKSGSISEIAYEVGYSNLSYFSKSYKDAFGLTPSET